MNRKAQISWSQFKLAICLFQCKIVKIDIIFLPHLNTNIFNIKFWGFHLKLILTSSILYKKLNEPEWIWINLNMQLLYVAGLNFNVQVCNCPTLKQSIKAWNNEVLHFYYCTYCQTHMFSMIIKIIPKLNELNFDGLERGWNGKNHNDQKDEKGTLIQ